LPAPPFKGSFVKFSFFGEKLCKIYEVEGGFRVHAINNQNMVEQKTFWAFDLFDGSFVATYSYFADPTGKDYSINFEIFTDFGRVSVADVAKAVVVPSEFEATCSKGQDA
jgi:hypothetical protein